MTQELTQLRDMHLGRVLLKLERQFTQQVLSKLAEQGITEITLRHFVVIPFVTDVGIRSVEIAKKAGVSKQAVGKLVEELEGYGYLEVRPDPNDGRASLVFLSDKGEHFLQTAIESTNILEKQWQQLIGAKRFNNMKQALIDLLVCLEA
ncbi:MAG: DNA-binding MarR family transcriptional regulator [Oleispira sp.]